jgi:hypothetical protein
MLQKKKKLRNVKEIVKCTSINYNENGEEKKERVPQIYQI